MITTLIANREGLDQGKLGLLYTVFKQKHIKSHFSSDVSASCSKNQVFLLEQICIDYRIWVSGMKRKIKWWKRQQLQKTQLNFSPLPTEMKSLSLYPWQWIDCFLSSFPLTKNAFTLIFKIYVKNELRQM